MKRYTPEELGVVLADHQKWRLDLEGGKRAYLRGADLRGADLQNADLQNADLQNADLRGADLRDADLQNADLRGAYLRDADLQDADLRGADLQGAHLRGAHLRGAELRGADLQGADLRGADLRGNLKIKTLAVFSGLYAYVAMPIITDDGTEWVRLGCHTHRVSDWEVNFWNNNGEFPDDGSAKSQMRLMAYNTCLEWLRIHRVPTEALPTEPTGIEPKEDAK